MFWVAALGIATVHASAVTEAPARGNGRVNDPRVVNFRTEPLGAIFNVYAATADVGVSDALTLGPSLGFFRTVNGVTTTTAWQIGANATWYPTARRLSTGWVVRALVSEMPVTVSQTVAGVGYRGSTQGYSFGLLGGYQWFFWKGLNVGVGAGVAYFGGGGPILESSQDGMTRVVKNWFTRGLQPSLEASVGWGI